MVGVIPAYIPRIGAVLSQGLHYDMAVAEEVTHENEVTHHPIEDPTRSFINDHNRELPTTINLSLIVGTVPLLSNEAGQNIPIGAERLARFQDQILSMRAAQSVGSSAYFTVYTGIRTYFNMGIESLTFRREPETPNILEVDMSLVEFRFARPPRKEKQTYLMDANDGPRNVANAILVDNVDRPITEAVRDRFTPRLSSLTPHRKAMLRESILRSRWNEEAGIVVTGVRDDVVADNLRLLMLDDTPAQQYTLPEDGYTIDIRFEYNQIGGRWSFSAGITDALCPSVGGRFVEPGFDLLAGVSGDTMIIPFDVPGILAANLDWYSRLITPLDDGGCATMLAVGSAASFAALVGVRSEIYC